MKKTLSASVGKRNFIFEENAYTILEDYLNCFNSELVKEGNASPGEVMEELEMRVADLFREKMYGGEVVDEALVRTVISQLGMPTGQSFCFSGAKYRYSEEKPVRRLFRNKDNCSIGGVCSGIACYFNIDVVLVRVLFVLAIILGLAGFWIYVIFWIIVPPAKTAEEKCQMYGLKICAENLMKFSSSK